MSLTFQAVKSINIHIKRIIIAPEGIKMNKNEIKKEDLSFAQPDNSRASSKRSAASKETIALLFILPPFPPTAAA